MDSSFSKLLREVERPSRYIGDELGLPSAQNFDGKPRLKVVLGFPDVYEVGMSHLGFRLLHAGLLELSGEGIQVERVFLPYADMQRRLQQKGLPLFTLEHQTPLNQVDLLGLSVQYELAYPALIKTLDLGGIPRRAKDRRSARGDDGEQWPLILLGGSAALNPEPLSPFVDLVFLGEADHALPEMVLALADLEHATREEKLACLGAMDGVYVPEWVEVRHSPESLELELTSTGPEAMPLLPIERRLVEDLDSLPVPPINLVPSCNLIHDRVVVEIQRGCSQGCRFCQAGFVTRPTRQRGEERVLEEARRLLDQTGYQSLALLSLSAGDHPRLMPMLTALIREHGPRNVAVSLPSMRTETLQATMAKEISKVRQTSFTLAPEAATDRLRRVINKQNTDEDLMTAVESVFKAGYGRLKLYFMLGLPTETDEDLLAMGTLVDRAYRRAKQVRSHAILSVSVSTFVPKPHTAFQWEEAPSIQEVERKLSLLRGAMPRRVKLRWHTPGQSLVEAYLARGDRRLADVLERVVDQEHTGLDAWTEHFSMQRWQSALDLALEAGEIPPPELYLGARDPALTLPWDHLHFGVDRRYLVAERSAAHATRTRPDCTDGDCDHCGVCPDEPEHRLAQAPLPGVTAESAGAAETASGETETPTQPAIKPQRVQTPRIWFEKRGRAALIGHLEMMVLFERAVRRAGLPLLFSQGYHPKPKMRFSPALPLGAESLCEFLEVDLQAEMDPEELLRALDLQLPPGLDLTRVDTDNEQVLSRIQGIRWLITPDPPLTEDDLTRARARLASGPLEYRRGTKKRIRDLSSIITSFDPAANGGALVSCRFGQEGTAKPEEILIHLLGMEQQELHGCRVLREGWNLAEIQQK